MAEHIQCSAVILLLQISTNVTVGYVISAVAQNSNILVWQVNPVGLMLISAVVIPTVAVSLAILVNIWTIVSRSRFAHILRQENNRFLL